MHLVVELEHEAFAEPKGTCSGQHLRVLVLIQARPAASRRFDHLRAFLQCAPPADKDVQHSTFRQRSQQQHPKMSRQARQQHRLGHAWHLTSSSICPNEA